MFAIEILFLHHHKHESLAHNVVNQLLFTPQLFTSFISCVCFLILYQISEIVFFTVSYWLGNLWKICWKLSDLKVFCSFFCYAKRKVSLSVFFFTPLDEGIVCILFYRLFSWIQRNSVCCLNNFLTCFLMPLPSALSRCLIKYLLRWTDEASILWNLIHIKLFSKPIYLAMRTDLMTWNYHP